MSERQAGTLEARLSDFQASKWNVESLQSGLPTPTEQQTTAETRASSVDKFLEKSQQAN